MYLCDTMEEIVELARYADLEDSEIGELCRALMHTARYLDYMSEEFKVSLVEEIRYQLKMFKENTRIVETEETYIEKFKTLEWI